MFNSIVKSLQSWSHLSMTQPSSDFKLNKGDTIGIFAPSSYVDMNKLTHAQTIIEKIGFQVFVHPQTSMRLNQSAGSAEDKATAFHDLLTDNSIKAIMAVSGGNRSSHMLEHINWQCVEKNPKPFIGFSDTTILQNALLTRTGISSIFGPTALYLQNIDKTSINYLGDILQGKTIKYNLSNAKTIAESTATATVIGGTLTAFQALIGTEYMPDAKGKILRG